MVPTPRHRQPLLAIRSAHSTLLSLLQQLGHAIREAVRAQQSQPTEDLAAVAHRSSADVIYQIDKVSESLILDWLEAHWPKDRPVRLVMEGIEDDQSVTFPPDTPPDRIAATLIIDPIDGTRGLMYDKRPAWALIGLAPAPEARTLEDIAVAVMTELPTSKQYLAEQLSATRAEDGSTTFSRVSKNLITGETRAIPHTPSRATDLAHGFASVAKFFPQAKTALAAFEEELFLALAPEAEKQEALVFDDQYISTGGQLYELIAGHDRLVVDIRPLAYAQNGYPDALACHPYDLCAVLVARAAGVIVEPPQGPTLDIPLDTTTPVSWIAYANENLARTIRPVIESLIQKRF